MNTPKIDTLKTYGLVLEGGGAKGAYQIGAWKALKEYDIQITGIVGSSVGALNGALICMDSFNEAIKLWKNISYSQIMDVKDDIIEDIREFELKNINYGQLLNGIKKFILNGGIDITPLKTLIFQLLDEECLRNSNKDFGLVTVSVSDLKSLEVFIEDIPKGKLLDYLIASSYLPVFKKEKLNGKRFLDGGFHNNLPINMLINRDYKNIIVIRIYGIGIERKIKISPDIHIIEIAPNEDLGGILEFSKYKSNYNMQLGYYDTLRIIKGLQGRKYYIELTINESQLINSFLNLSDEVKKQLMNLFNIKEIPFLRALFEIIFPKIARVFNLSGDYNYLDILIEMIEHYALRFSIKRFHIYTDVEILNVLKKIIVRYESEKILYIEASTLRFVLLNVLKELKLI